MPPTIGAPLPREPDLFLTFAPPAQQPRELPPSLELVGNSLKESDLPS